MGLKAVRIDHEHAVMGVKGHDGPQPNWSFGSMKEFADVMAEVHDA